MPLLFLIKTKMKNIVVTFSLILIHASLYSQLCIDAGISLLQTNTFTWTNGRAFQSNAAAASELTVSYIFNKRENNNSISYEPKLGFSTYDFSGTQNNISLSTSFIQVKGLSTFNISRRNNGDMYPLFDINFGFGYGIAKPVYSTFQISSHDLSYLHHNLIGHLGLFFYTSYGSRFGISLYNQYSLIAQKLNNFNSLSSPMLFLAQGIQITIGGDIINSLKTVYRK